MASRAALLALLQATAPAYLLGRLAAARVQVDAGHDAGGKLGWPFIELDRLV